MTDKEVGDLWQCVSSDGCGNFSKAEVNNLIRKLVKERAWKIAANYYGSLPDSEEEKNCYKAALRDFGINPEQFDKEIAAIESP